MARYWGCNYTHADTVSVLTRVRPASSGGSRGTSGTPCRQSRGIDPPVSIRRGEGVLWRRQEEGKSRPSVPKLVVSLVWPLPGPAPLPPAVRWYYFQHEWQSTHVLHTVSWFPHWEVLGPHQGWSSTQKHHPRYRGCCWLSSTTLSSLLAQSRVDSRLKGPCASEKIWSFPTPKKLHKPIPT